MPSASRRERWYTSDRRYRLPSDWGRRKAAVRARARGRCQAASHAPGCNGVGTECDHIVAGDDHDLDNLQWLSHECHKAKTERENAERTRRRKLMRLHPSERQPGLLDWTPRGWEGTPRRHRHNRRIAPPVVRAPEIPVFPPASFSAGLVPFAPPVAVSSARWGLPRSRDAFLAVRLSPLQAMSRYE